MSSPGGTIKCETICAYKYPMTPETVAQINITASSINPGRISERNGHGGRLPTFAASARAVPRNVPIHQVATTPQYRAIAEGSVSPSILRCATVKYSKQIRAVI